MNKFLNATGGAADFRDLCVTVMGLGRHGGGAAATRFLAEHGARVTVTDLAGEAELGDTLTQLQDVSLAALVLGEHRVTDFTDADLIVVNPAVRPRNQFVRAARHAGVTITSEIELFLNRCSATVIGVTGSNGKSTTAAMIHSICQTADRTSWLGGNIERSLLPELVHIAPADVVVLELSSFQLAWLGTDAGRPEFVVVTNCAPNHLDWHPDFASYVRAKQRILNHKDARQTLITDAAEESVSCWRDQHIGSVASSFPDERVPALQVAGRHNRRNAALAAAATDAIGCERQAIDRGLQCFGGLPHRLQLLGEIGRRKIINDSQATTPEATIAALEACDDPPCWLLVGGADKGCDFGPLAHQIASRAAGVACFGTVGAQLARLVARHGGCEADVSVSSGYVDTLQEAFSWCWRQSQVGDTILLSPGCSSLDQYQDYRQRADDFARCARRYGEFDHHHQKSCDLV